MWRFIIALSPIAWLLWRLGFGAEPRGRLHLPLVETMQVNPNSMWRVTGAARLSACENRPGLKKLYLRVLDEKGEGLAGIVVRFGWESGRGIAYDHPQVWGLTDDDGFIEWDHFGVPTRYSFYMEDDESPFVENIRTDLGNEYCQPGGYAGIGTWRPINRPGIYSYRFEVQRRGSE